jgi:hypothetical protein
LDDRHDHDGFWETLDETIEEILAEVDRMIAFGWTKQQTVIGHHRADNRPRIKANEDDGPTITLDYVDDSYETDDLRRPQEEMNTGRSRQRRGHVHHAHDRYCSRTLVASTRPRKASRPLTEIVTSVRRVVRNAWCIGVLAVPRTVSPVASLVVVADFEA